MIAVWYGLLAESADDLCLVQAAIIFKSETVLDVVKDSVAVSFICEIDGYAYMVLSKMFRGHLKTMTVSDVITW